MNRVFQIDSDRAGRDNAANGFANLACIVRKTGLDIRTHRNCNDASDTRDRRDHFIARHRFAVRIAD